MGGTNRTPDFEVTLADNFRHIMEEYGDTIWFFFFLGMICGIIISYTCYKIYKLVKSKQKNEKEVSKAETSEEAQKSKIENDKIETKFIVGFIIMIVLICSIAVGFAIERTNNNEDRPTIQANEKTNDFVL